MRATSQVQCPPHYSWAFPVTSLSPVHLAPVRRMDPQWTKVTAQSGGLGAGQVRKTSTAPTCMSHCTLVCKTEAEKSDGARTNHSVRHHCLLLSSALHEVLDTISLDGSSDGSQGAFFRSYTSILYSLVVPQLCETSYRYVPHDTSGIKGIDCASPNESMVGILWTLQSPAGKHHIARACRGGSWGVGGKEVWRVPQTWTEVTPTSCGRMADGQRWSCYGF